MQIDVSICKSFKNKTRRWMSIDILGSEVKQSAKWGCSNGTRSRRVVHKRAQTIFGHKVNRLTFHALNHNSNTIFETKNFF
jgi:hypothetical protein